MIDAREHFQKEMNKLNDLILKMGGMVEANIAKAIKSIGAANVIMAQEVIRSDDELDALELEVDDLCLELLATQQPMAIDLRFITTGMRIGTDLERIGDLAVDIAQRSIELSKHPLLKPLIDTPKMAELTQHMVRMALDAFVKRDAYLARSLWEDEARVDKYRDLITEELEDIMRKDAATVTRGLPLVMITRHLERIGDHATNIAEDVVYMVEGKVIKHAAKD
jgi:phosphate transport system protein